MDKVISSPLTYWGAKRWLFPKVHALIPDGETEIFSPFLGGGSIEINLAYRGYTVHAYDNYTPLVNFWQQWLSEPESVRLAVYELLSLYTHEDLNRLETDSAAYYLLQNRMAFRGMPNRSLTMPFLRYDGEYVVRPYKKTGNRQLFYYWDFWQSKPLSTLNVQQADFEQVFWIHEHQFAYIDPPYFESEGDYGGCHNGFNHEKLRELLDKRAKWILSYSDHPKAYELYDGFHIQPIRRGSDGKTELLITSPDIATQQLYLF